MHFYQVGFSVRGGAQTWELQGEERLTVEQLEDVLVACLAEAWVCRQADKGQVVPADDFEDLFNFSGQHLRAAFVRRGLRMVGYEAVCHTPEGTITPAKEWIERPENGHDKQICLKMRDALRRVLRIAACAVAQKPGETGG